MGNKLSSLIEEMQMAGVDGLLIASVSNIKYLTAYPNFSKDEREAYLLLTGKNLYIFTDGRYSEAIRREVPDFELIEISSENTLNKSLGILSKKHGIKRLGVEEDILTVIEYKKIGGIFDELIHVDTKIPRSIKEEFEVQRIKKACRIGDLAYKFILGKIKLGVSEKEIAFLLEDFIRREGAEISFESIVAFGNNSSVPHHHTGESKLTEKEGQFILLDFGVKYKNYCSDMTRTVFYGEPSDKQKKIYNTVLEAQKKAVDYINKNNNKKIKFFEVDQVARKFITSAGYPPIPHSLGHGIGIEVHEPPYLPQNSREILKEGMVFSIEPGIYFSGFGGVRIEDLFLFREGKLQILTNSDRSLHIL